MPSWCSSISKCQLSPSATDWTSFLCKEGILGRLSFFFVVVVAYSRSFSIFSEWLIFSSLNQMKVTTFSNSLSSWVLHGVSLKHFRQRSRWKSDPYDGRLGCLTCWTVTLWLLFLGLVPAYQPPSHSLLCVRTWSAVAVLSVQISAVFEKLFLKVV